MAGLGEADLSPPGPPARTKEGAPRSRPRLPLKAAPEGAVETDYGLASPLGKICRVCGCRPVIISAISRYFWGAPLWRMADCE